MKLNSKMRKFKMTKKMMAFSIASAGLMAGAVAVAIFTTSCSKTYTLNSIDQNNADTSNRKFDKGNKMIINRDLIQAVCPCYCYLRTQLSNNTTSLQTNYAFFQNSSTYNYKLLHTGATIYVLQIGGSSLMGVNV
ncbi:hypothetical protein FACS1894166_03560 [Bacilli bacterium]|nr:hypothetical protein FACS1894166_03560 [Bacilli bacterium]